MRKRWGKEGYLSRKGNQAEKEDGVNPVLQGNDVLGEPIVGNILSQAGQETPSLSEEEKAKQRLASSLFVGLGSQGSVNLVREPFG